MSETDNIELRSEKVRNIIGQIPPRIIRSGISIIFIVTVVLLTGSYFFKYSYTINTQIILTYKDNEVTGSINVNANELNKIKQGHQVIVDFSNIPNMNKEYLICTIDSISSELIVTPGNAYSIIFIKSMDSLITNSGKTIIFEDNIIANAKVITDEISFFNRIIQPIKFLLLNR